MIPHDIFRRIHRHAAPYLANRKKCVETHCRCFDSRQRHAGNSKVRQLCRSAFPKPDPHVSNNPSTVCLKFRHSKTSVLTQTGHDAIPGPGWWSRIPQPNADLAVNGEKFQETRTASMHCARHELKGKWAACRSTRRAWLSPSEIDIASMHRSDGVSRSPLSSRCNRGPSRESFTNNIGESHKHVLSSTKINLQRVHRGVNWERAFLPDLNTAVSSAKRR